MFRDRKDAGQNLARALSKYKDKGVLVLGIARGGVEIAYEVARYLNAEMSILVTRKLPLPFNPEAGFGAIAEDGSEFIREDTYDWLSESEVERIIEVLRGGKPLPKIEERTVILVDDGLAMGSTMRASIDMCKKNNAGKIIVAVPVSGSETAQEIEKIADELIILEMPPYFRAVAQIYLNWHDVSDQEVQNFMRKWKRLRAKETEK